MSSRTTNLNIGYLEILAIYYPNVFAKRYGVDDTYEGLVHLGGDPIPPIETLDAKKIEYTKDQVWLKIKALRDYKLNEGGYPTSVGWFHSDPEAQLNYEDLYKKKGLLQYMPVEQRMWKKMGGGFVPMTEAIVDEIFSVKTTQKMSIFAKAVEHDTAMRMSSDPLNYDFTVGWPLTFQEV